MCFDKPLLFALPSSSVQNMHESAYTIFRRQMMRSTDSFKRNQEVNVHVVKKTISLSLCGLLCKCFFLFGAVKGLSLSPDFLFSIFSKKTMNEGQGKVYANAPQCETMTTQCCKIPLLCNSEKREVYGLFVALLKPHSSQECENFSDTSFKWLKMPPFLNCLQGHRAEFHRFSCPSPI